MRKWGEPRWRPTRIPFPQGGVAVVIGDPTIDCRTWRDALAVVVRDNLEACKGYEGHLTSSLLKHLWYEGVIVAHVDVLKKWLRDLEEEHRRYVEEEERLMRRRLEMLNAARDDWRKHNEAGA